MIGNKKRLGELLLAEEHIGERDLDRALHLQASSGGRIGSALIRVGAISEDSLLEVLSRQLEMPIMDENSLPESSELYAFMNSCDESFGWFLFHQVIIWERGSGELWCVGKDVLDPEILEVLRHFHSGKVLQFGLITTHLLERRLSELKQEYSVESLFQLDAESKELRELAEEAPVVEFVNNIFAQAVDAGASDIHIEPEEKGFDIRFRIDGVLQFRLSQPLERFAAVASRIKLVAGLDIAERRLPQDGRLTTRMGGAEMDVRVSTVPCVHGESLVMRLLPKDRNELTLANLGMEDDHLETMRNWARSSGGIVLVTGPTGSGKSTTLHAALSDSNDGVRKIITVEDPVEVRVPGITQIQTQSEIGYDFARALRAILRQDPDVIMIGEIRDLETAEIAIQSALSGHLVLSTLHTNEALSSFTRLIDMGVEPFLVAAPIKGVQAQRLVRRLCLRCAVEEAPGQEVLGRLKGIQTDLLGNRWLKAKGCQECQLTGYTGRMGIYQLVEVNAALQDLVVKGATLNDMRRFAEDHGMRNLLQDGLIKASRGLTSVDEVFRVVSLEDMS